MCVAFTLNDIIFASERQMMETVTRTQTVALACFARRAVAGQIA